MNLTLGSLFDGSGGFPLGGLLCEVRPVWASEIEPFPIRVTTKRLPQVKHLGDISCVNGADIEPVDIITFGSPCTDLSIAGRRDGLSGKQSGLFFEAIRIIKEMRAATNGTYPRWIIWENVPGAFSSNRGEDFRQVLTEIVRVAEPQAPEVPAPYRGSWQPAELLLGDGWSVAYRVIDAAAWVPQRRKRIYLVADFGSERAADVLFEREGERRDFAQGGFPWQAAAGDAALGPGGTVAFEPKTLKMRSGCAGGGKGALVQNNLSAALSTSNDQTVFVQASDSGTLLAVENHPADSRLKLSKDGLVQTLSGRMGTGGGNVPMVYGIGNGQTNQPPSPERAATLTCMHDAPAVVYSLDRAAYNQGENAQYDFSVQMEQAQTIVARGPSAIAEPAGQAVAVDCRHDRIEEISGTLVAKSSGGNGVQDNNPVMQNYVVRRLTPRECAKLQGFPPDWCSGLETPEPTEEDVAFWVGVFETHRRIIGKSTKPKTRGQIIKWLRAPHTDGAEYKLWGNGVALPCVVFVMQGIVELARGG